MKTSINSNTDICITGIGCVLPDAKNPQKFWQNILDGQTSIKDVPLNRWDKSIYYSADKNAEDKTYSYKAAFIEDSDINEIANKHNLDQSKYNRLQIQTFEAMAQAKNCLNIFNDQQRFCLFLGCMNLDESSIKQKFFENNITDIEQYIIQNFPQEKDKIVNAIRKQFNQFGLYSDNNISNHLTTSVINLIKEKFNLKGEGAIVDAACASSLAAIEISCNYLKTHQADIAITGGMESNLSPESFVVFSKVKALSEDICLPFDKRSKGLSQGEGSVIFILQRLEDAIRDGNNIYSIIRSIGSSSDGKTSSLFSPSIEGQVRAYKQAYKKLHSAPITFIEAHGTGTRIGDQTEIASLNTYFTEDIPIGSTKFIVGHTKGAAGAVSMLKCILSMQNKLLPANYYINESIIPKNSSIHIKNISIDLNNQEIPLRYGISAFGFGGINYHLVMDEYIPGSNLLNEEINILNERMVINGYTRFPINKPEQNSIASKFNIPPNSIPQMDTLQLLALLAFKNVLSGIEYNFNKIKKENICVISASILGLKSLDNVSARVNYFDVENIINFLDKNKKTDIINLKNKYPKITEDSGPGVLNNVIAGRICHEYDIQGKNINIDADIISSQTAIKIASNEIAFAKGPIVLLLCEEEITDNPFGIKCNFLNCLIVSNLNISKKYNLPIISEIEKIDYFEIIGVTK